MGELSVSIFRQKTYEKIYDIVKTQFHNGFYGGYDIRISNNSDLSKLLSDDIITKHPIELPLLEVGESFFLHDLGVEVVIKSRMRSSDNSVVYYVEDKFIETENSKESKERWTKVMVEHYDILDGLKKCQREFKEYRTKYEYKKVFGLFFVKCKENFIDERIL